MFDNRFIAEDDIDREGLKPRTKPAGRPPRGSEVRDLCLFLARHAIETADFRDADSALWAKVYNGFAAAAICEGELIGAAVVLGIPACASVAGGHGAVFCMRLDPGDDFFDQDRALKNEGGWNPWGTRPTPAQDLVLQLMRESRVARATRVSDWEANDALRQAQMVPLFGQVPRPLRPPVVSADRQRFMPRRPSLSMRTLALPWA